VIFIHHLLHLLPSSSFFMLFDQSEWEVFQSPYFDVFLWSMKLFLLLHTYISYFWWIWVVGVCWGFGWLIDWNIDEWMRQIIEWIWTCKEHWNVYMIDKPSQQRMMIKALFSTNYMLFYIINSNWNLSRSKIK